MKRLLNIIYYSFPFRLLVMHLQKSTTLLALWVFIALLLSGNLGRAYGILYLFLAPEYMGKVWFWSFFFIGFGFGGFLMVWNITTYMLNSFRFPFLASLKKPFFKFCVNNAVLPICFLLFYFINFLIFQTQTEGASAFELLTYILAFSCGFILILSITIIYFIYTNKNIFKFVRRQTPPAPNRPLPSRKTLYSLSDVTTWRVDFYLNEKLNLRRTRDVRHYSSNLLLKVFRQHHLNAFIFQLGNVIALIILAYMMDSVYFRIPAGASILILCAMLTSIIGAIKYWFKSWRVVTFIVILLLINVFTSQVSFYENHAYGMNYQTEKKEYDYHEFDNIATLDNFHADTAHTISILENWKKKQDTEKPKMVIVCVSGGGLRATAWTTRVLGRLDEVTKGQLLKNTVLITGASGGTIGAAYMRDLYWNAQNNPEIDLNDNIHYDIMSTDLQNSLGFSIATNDIFIPWIPFWEGEHRYVKDRAYIFEKQLIENTDSLLAKKIMDYRQAEINADIPMFFLTPVVVNDARRLIISPQGVSYMMKPLYGFIDTSHIEIDGIDFGRFFKKQEADSLRITSALRMNATYPMILPNVSLPTKNRVEAMDAGWRDNYGFDVSLRFLNVFKHWVKENTSGVVLLEIRSFEKKNKIEYNQKGVINRIFSPFSPIGQMPEVQDYHQDSHLSYFIDFLGQENVNVLKFEYMPTKKNQRASMSWHLTKREREDIYNAMSNPKSKNPSSEAQLLKILEE